MKIINVTPEMTVLPLGRLGENETTQFVFDVSDWLEEYPGGTIGLAHRLPHTRNDYACTITNEGDGKYSWTITSAELTTEGCGKCELILIKDSKVKKGKVYKTLIGEALDPDQDPPSVWQGYVTDVLHKKEDAEAYAVGKRSGTDVGETDPTYHNNAKYYSEQASGSASAAAGSATTAGGKAQDAEAYAIGKRGGTDVESTDPAYHNNSKYYAENCESLIEAATTTATTNATAAVLAAAEGVVDGYSKTSEAYAVGKRGGTDVGSSDPAYHNNSKYYSEQAATSATAAHTAQLAAEAAAAEEVSDWLEAHVDPETGYVIDNTLTVTGAAADAKKVGDEIGDLKSAINYLNKKYFVDNLTSSSDSIVYTHTGIMMSANDQIVLVQKATSTLCVAYVYPQAYADGTDIKAKGTYTITAPAAGELYIAHRVADVDIYYPDFAIVSDEGASKVLAASQYLVKTAFDEIDELGDDVEELSDQLEGKYDRYHETEIEGLSLDMFAIKPSQYQVVQYNDSDCLYFTSVSPANNCFSKFKTEITDIKFKVASTYLTGTASTGTYIAVACTAEKAIAFITNATTDTVYLYTSSSRSKLTSVYRNENCRSVAVGDTIHIVRNGTKVAIYLVDNETDVPILADEFIDVLAMWGETAGIVASDVGIGFASSNSSRGENLAYDFVQKTETGDHFMDYDEVDSRLSALEEGSGYNPKKVDLFMFMGQSNMAGRGTGNQAPAVDENAGYEFRAISDPTKLYNIVEPFGVAENVQNKINDSYGSSSMKSGDMIPAFVNAYFKHTHVSVVGVSASEGGTRLAYWQPETARDEDAEDRFDAAVTYLTTNGYTIRHKYMLWCQGETDGDLSTSKADYKTMFTAFAEEWFDRGIETIFVIKIGNYNGENAYDYNTVMTAQNEICQEMENVVMVCTDFAGMKERDLMKDAFHYKQAGYNEVGTYAGINTAIYVNTGKEPTMYDTQDGSLYFSHKN